MKLLLLVLILILALAPPVSAVVIGDPAPDFFTEDIQGGDPITISGYQDKVVLLIFFWTG